MKGNLFLKLKGQTNNKNKLKFLNVTFLNKFCICSRENGGKWCLCFNTSYFTYFWYSLCRKLTKSLALHGFGEIFTHAIWLISPDTPRFCSTIFRNTGGLLLNHKQSYSVILANFQVNGLKLETLSKIGTFEQHFPEYHCMTAFMEMWKSDVESTNNFVDFMFHKNWIFRKHYSLCFLQQTFWN